MKRATVLGIVFAAALAGHASIAGAGERPGRVLFERAEAKFNVGHFDEALVDYQAAYDAEPLPAFLFNIGQCYRNLGNYERAQFFFRRYTTLDPRSPNRPAAERLIAEMERLSTEPPAPATDKPALALAAPTEHTPPAYSPAAVATKTGDGDTRRPIYRRAWFWVAVSAVVVAGGVATAFAVTQDDPHSSLRPIDAR